MTINEEVLSGRCPRSHFIALHNTNSRVPASRSTAPEIARRRKRYTRMAPRRVRLCRHARTPSAPRAAEHRGTRPFRVRPRERRLRFPLCTIFLAACEAHGTSPPSSLQSIHTCPLCFLIVSTRSIHSRVGVHEKPPRPDVLRRCRSPRNRRDPTARPASRINSVRNPRSWRPGSSRQLYSFY